MQLKLDGYFFGYVNQLNHYSEEEIEVMQRTKEQLKVHSTETFRPGMLLGRIQSGKTRSYIGTMALGLDDVFDCVVILTKNSNALARQTYARVAAEFRRAMDEDKVIVHDIIRMPKLRKYELKQKQIIIVKKEIKNVVRLEQFFID